jgi:hypothetical protein
MRYLSIKEERKNIKSNGKKRNYSPVYGCAYSQPLIGGNPPASAKIPE